MSAAEGNIFPTTSPAIISLPASQTPPQSPRDENTQPSSPVTDLAQKLLAEVNEPSSQTFADDKKINATPLSTSATASPIPDLDLEESQQEVSAPSQEKQEIREQPYSEKKIAPKKGRPLISCAAVTTGVAFAAIGLALGAEYLGYVPAGTISRFAPTL
jgi:hypothetical protein